MPEGASSARPTKLFIGCFAFCPDPDLAPDGDDGTFQIVVEARDADDAATKCRARLREMATTNSLGPVLVYARAFIEVAPGDLIRGIVINHQAIDPEVSYCFLPPQGEVASIEHFPDEENGQELDDLEEPAGLAELAESAPLEEGEAHEDDADWDDVDESFGPVFWARWKLYWCQTSDHDEDSFVVALSAAEAEAFYEDAEGYDEGEADAEFICVLPEAAQVDADREQAGWPSDELLVACGAEFLRYSPLDGAEALRKQLGSRARVVRINGRVFSEGDIVSNTRHRLGAEPDA